MSRHILTRMTNPSEQFMPATSITPLKVRIMANRRSNPAPKSSRRRRNPDFRRAAMRAGVQTAGLAAGLVAAKKVDQYMNDVLATAGVEAQTLGLFKLVGTFGVLLAGEYLAAQPAVMGNEYLREIVPTAVVGLATFGAASALDLLAGTDILSSGGTQGALSYASANKSGTGAYAAPALGTFRRRSARGTIIQSPTLASQIAPMGGTAMLAGPGMRGSLEMFGTPQPNALRMQGTGMGASYETRCL
jgi:hypothetical protein